MAASIVEIVSSDKGIELANDYWVRQSDLLSGTWGRVIVAARIMFNTSVTTLLTGTPQIWFGICNGTAAAPGQVINGSVNHALFFRSSLATWAVSGGSFQVGASGGAQIRQIESGAVTTTALTTISRLGGLSGTTPIRMPIYLDISKDSGSWTVNVSRRTTTTSVVDIGTSAFMDSLQYDSMDSIAHVNTNGVALTVNEGTHGAMNSVFASWDRPDVACRISEFVVVRKW